MVCVKSSCALSWDTSWRKKCEMTCFVCNLQTLGWLSVNYQQKLGCLCVEYRRKYMGHHGDPGCKSHQGLDLGCWKKPRSLPCTLSTTPPECPTLKIGPGRKLHNAKNHCATKHLECLTTVTGYWKKHPGQDPLDGYCGWMFRVTGGQKILVCKN